MMENTKKLFYYYDNKYASDDMLEVKTALTNLNTFNATLNIRINPDVKSSAEKVLSQLGVPMSTAIDIFLKQVTLTGSIPFAIALPKAPKNINMEMMSVSQIRGKLNEGLSDVENGKVRPAREAFERFKERHSDEAL